MPTIDFGHWTGRRNRNRLPHLADQSFGEVGGAGGFACRWKLISIAHPNPENGYAPPTSEILFLIYSLPKSVFMQHCNALLSPSHKREASSSRIMCLALAVPTLLFGQSFTAS